MSKEIKYFLIRSFMRTVGRLSDGIRLCYQEGLTSGKMLDYIYKNRPSGRMVIGRIIDERFLSDPGWEAVRVRRSNLEMLIIKAIEGLRRQNKNISLVDIASGPAAYIMSVLDKVGGGDIQARCRDFEERWVKEGRRFARARGLAYNEPSDFPQLLA